MPAPHVHLDRPMEPAVAPQGDPRRMPSPDGAPTTRPPRYYDFWGLYEAQARFLRPVAALALGAACLAGGLNLWLARRPPLLFLVGETGLAQPVPVHDAVPSEVAQAFAGDFLRAFLSFSPRSFEDAVRSTVPRLSEGAARRLEAFLRQHNYAAQVAGEQLVQSFTPLEAVLERRSPPIVFVRGRLASVRAGRTQEREVAYRVVLHARRPTPDRPYPFGVESFREAEAVPGPGGRP